MTVTEVEQFYLSDANMRFVYNNIVQHEYTIFS